METGWAAVRLSAAGFIIPFVFVFHPDILLIVDGFSIWGVVWALAAFAVATWGLATGLIGWEGQNLPVWQRLGRVVAGLACLATDWRIALGGLALLVGFSFLRWLQSPAARLQRNSRDLA